jgi:hypothetical protein
VWEVLKFFKEPFGQYSSRILEQCMYTNYKPYLNIKDEQLKDIIFFNFSLQANELLLSLDHTHVYIALYWTNKLLCYWQNLILIIH